MANENYIDYGVMEQGIAVYQQQAEAIGDVMSALKSMNGSLEGGWRNDTARAFLEKYKSTYEPAMREVMEAVSDLSMTMTKYMQKRQEEDAANAAAVS